MSKKTFFKRIAVTAIAALGLGMLSIAPSQATVTSHTLTIDSATDAIETNDTATAVLTHNFVNLGSAYDSVMIYGAVTSANATTAGTMTFSVTDSYTSTGNTGLAANAPVYGYGESAVFSAEGLAGTIFSNTTGASGTNKSTTRDSITIAARSADVVNNGSVLTVRMYNMSKAGTYTVSFFTKVSNGGAAPTSSTVSATWTITVTDPTRTASAGSTVTLRKGNVSAALGTYFGGTAEGTDSQTLAAASGSLTSTTPEFQLYVKQKSAVADNTARESYTVQVSGNAYVSLGHDMNGDYAPVTTTRPSASTGLKWLQAATPIADSATIINVWSNGTAGAATITVTSNAGLVLGTKTVTFYDDVASIKVYTSLYQRKIVQAGGKTSGTMFWVEALDANGNRVLNVDPEIVSSNVAAITGGTCLDASSGVSDGLSACTLSSAVGSTSGSTADITIRTADPADATGATYLTATYAGVKLGGSVASEVITLDKTSYAPGEKMVVTVTAKDSSGNPVYDGASAPTLSVNKAIGGSLTMSTYVGGVATSATRSATTGLVTNDSNLFAPAASGSFIVSGVGTDAAGTVISVSGTVSDDGATAAASAATDAALEAIDAANAATDAANLAAEAADAATVAAEEARDAADAATAAVEALATEVATLMAALKAQITTLANTVAKIAKKVKA